MPRPYQPSLLRLLHGAAGLLTLIAWISGLVVYARFDHRWGALPFKLAGDPIEFHGTVGVILWPVAVLFGLYAITAGRRLLVRPANAIPLLSLALAVGSGLLMDEDWLLEGELDQFIYSVHLISWVLMALSVLWHLGSVLQRGGWPLARSMASVSLQANDLPRHWANQLIRSVRPGKR